MSELSVLVSCVQSHFLWTVTFLEVYNRVCLITVQVELSLSTSRCVADVMA